jgi:hypothetical protein
MAEHDDLDRRLKAADPLPAGIVHTTASRARLDEVRVRARSGPRAPQPRRPDLRFSLGQRATRRGLVIASAIGVLVVGGAAAATTILTSNTVVGAPGFCQTVLNATADIPFPSGDQAGRNWALLESVGPKPGTTLHELCDTAAGEHVGDGGEPGTTVVSLHSEKVWFVWDAFCAWTEQWLNATADGDTATASQAASEVTGALQWPASQAVDPHPNPAPNASSQLGWLIPAQQAVQADDVAEVTSLFDQQALSDPQANFYPGGFCYWDTPPAGSDNGTVLPGQA